MTLSENLRALLQTDLSTPISLGALLQRTGEKGFGVISGLLVLPMLIPLPVPLAGFSTLLGVGIALMGLQLAWGATMPHLPQRLAQIEFKPATTRRLLQNLNRILRPLERLAKQRWLKISGNPGYIRFLGLCLAWDAVLMGLPLPIPFTNLLPGYTILILAIGILERDGLFMLLGYGMTGITTVFFVGLADVIWRTLQRGLELLLNYPLTS